MSVNTIYKRYCGCLCRKTRYKETDRFYLTTITPCSLHEVPNSPTMCLINQDFTKIKVKKLSKEDKSRMIKFKLLRWGQNGKV